LLGSSGFPRLNIGTRTATAHAVGNIPDCRIPLNTLMSVGIRKSLNSMKYSFSNPSTPWLFFVLSFLLQLWFQPLLFPCPTPQIHNRLRCLIWPSAIEMSNSGLATFRLITNKNIAREVLKMKLVVIEIGSNLSLSSFSYIFVISTRIHKKSSNSRITFTRRTTSP